MDCTQKANASLCSCTYTSCDKRGACCRCIAYHRERNEMVGCYFTPEAERTYDRSMKAFAAQLR
ncbi:MAG: DUF6485 family protein [Deferrisomatales bacterium]|nr:DUF6485 family protein [Deferrisomatales bacterium]